jgi:hypothetical protein
VTGHEDSELEPDVGDAFEDLGLDDVDGPAGEVTGGRTPGPGGPVPIPYPNVAGS